VRARAIASASSDETVVAMPQASAESGRPPIRKLGGGSEAA
jgi:hypothetical protein